MFTEHLQLLADTSRRIDAGEFTDNDFRQLQTILPEIIKRYQDKDYTTRQYRILSGLYFLFMDMGRDNLGR